MIDPGRLSRSLRVGVALICIALMAAACNLGAPQAQTIPTQAAGTITVPATRTLIPGVPTSRVVTTTPIPFPTRVVQVFPTAYVPPQTNPQPTAQPLPYNIVILSPLPGNVVSGNISVLGSASHPQFLQYRLEFGPDPNPNNLWFPITGVVQSPLINGTLGVWSTNAGGSPDGYYQIRLRVFMRDGSQQITTVNNIRVQNSAPTPVPTATQSTPAPIAAFTQDYTTGTAPLVVRFFNQSQGNITSYLWNFGTGNLSSAINPIETFTRPGIYNVTLSVSGPGGSANVTRQINVTSPGAPTASFIPDKLSGPAPLTVSFTNRSTGNITSYEWDFGDGTVSKEVNPKHIFKTIGNYNVILKATGPGGSNSIVRQITVSNPQIPAPVADFVPGVTSGTVPFSVTFSSAKSTGQITEYRWDLDGDGTTDSNDKDPTATYTVAGKFTVTLTVTGPGGQSSKKIQIDAKSPPNAPTANFTADPTSGEAPLTVKFTNTSTGDVTKYEWDFNGDGGVDSTEKDPSFKYDNPATYTVRLKVTGAGGSTQKDLTISVSAPVPDAPVAAFTANPTSGQSPLKVIFTNDSTGQIDSFAWDFNGDGKADNTVDGTFEYTYSTPGTYAAALTVSNAGGSDTEQVTITVNAPPGAPTAAFTAAPATGPAPLKVIFTNTSTGTVDKLEWDFQNDGVIDSTAAGPIEFTYTTPGTYTAKLTASNSGGAASATQTIVVDNPVPNAPVASFTADPTSGEGSAENPLNVTFTSTSQGTIDKIEWDFDGDGTIDNETDSVASFGFDEAGTYNASLTVSNAGGSDTETVQITVNEPAVDAPVADFTASPTSGPAPLAVKFDNISSGQIDEFAWDVDGDGTVDSAANTGFDYTFQNPGTYEAALTVSNAGGSNTKFVTITVTEPEVEQPDAPVASFNADPTSGNAPLTVTFTNTSTGTVDSLSWDFNGDGTADNTTVGNAPVQFQYTAEGTFTASLTVTNAGGSTTAQKTITVGSAAPTAPVAAFNANPTSGNAPLTVTFTNNSTGTVDTLSWDFNGDNAPDNTTVGNTPVQFQYTTPGTYTARLTVTNAGGSDMEEVTITVNAALPDAPVASFTANPTSITTGQSVTFTNTSTGTVDTLSWDFNGDGSPDNTTIGNAPVTFQYDAPGTFTASLTVTNASGSNTAQQTITVGTPAPDAPVAGFSVNPTTVVEDQPVTFTSTSTGQVDNISWDLNGDGVAEDMSNSSVTFTYPDSGTFTASVTVTNAGGSNTFSQQITVGSAAPAAPVASFTAPTEAQPNVPVQFTSTSTGTVDTYAWDFDGNGSTDATDQNPMFTYTAAGTFTASLTVTNAGGSNTFSQGITVAALATPPTASFTVAPGTTVNAGDSVTFDSSATTGTVDSVLWDFNGDNSPDNTTDRTVTLPFNTAGTYTVTLSVTGAGQTSSTSQTITVNAAAPNVPAGQIVYVSGGDIFTSSTDGQNVQPITSDGDSQDISFSSNKIVFVSNQLSTNGGQDIYLIDLNDTSNVIRLTEDEAGNSDPVLSPDGSQVAFVSTAAGSKDIYLVPADGSTDPVLVMEGTEGSDESQPTWSPDGNFLAFVSNRDDGSGTDNDIYSIELSTDTVKNLTADDPSNDREPAWAPNGSRIAYTSDKAGAGNDDIWVMNPSDGGNKQARTSDGANETQPSWDSTGNYILYFRDGTIYIMKDDGTEQVPLSTSGAQSVNWR